MMRKDSGVTEVVSFIIILSIILIGCLLWVLIAVPIQGENNELTHNDEVLLEMANLKYDIDTLMVADVEGINRSCLISFSPRGDKTEITLLPDLSNLLSQGVVTIGGGEAVGTEYDKLKITFQSKNYYAENVTFVYDGGVLKDDEENVYLDALSGNGTRLVPVVPRDFTMEMGGNDFAIITFRADYSDIVDGQTVYVMDVIVRSSYNG